MKRIPVIIIMLIATVSSCSWLKNEPKLLAIVEYSTDDITITRPVYQSENLNYHDPEIPIIELGFKLGLYHSGQLVINDSLARLGFYLEADSLSMGFSVRSDTCFFKEDVPYYLASCDSCSLDGTNYNIKERPCYDPLFYCPRFSILDEFFYRSHFDPYGVAEDDPRYGLPRLVFIKDQSWCSLSIPDDPRQLSVKFEFKGKSIDEPADTVVVSGIIDIYKEYYRQVFLVQ